MTWRFEPGEGAAAKPFAASRRRKSLACGRPERALEGERDKAIWRSAAGVQAAAGVGADWRSRRSAPTSPRRTRCAGATPGVFSPVRVTQLCWLKCLDALAANHAADFPAAAVKGLRSRDCVAQRERQCGSRGKASAGSGVARRRRSLGGRARLAEQQRRAAPRLPQSPEALRRDWKTARANAEPDALHSWRKR